MSEQSSNVLFEQCRSKPVPVGRLQHRYPINGQSSGRTREMLLGCIV